MEKFLSTNLTPLFFRFKQNGRKYLITNDAGNYAILTSEAFEQFSSGAVSALPYACQEELIAKGFIQSHDSVNMLSRRIRRKKSFLGQGVCLHIVVVTLRCNQSCVYCQASACGVNERTYDMDSTVAQKVVERIFESPSHSITIEFQGGEPLLNFPVISLIVAKAKKKNRTAKKKLAFALVTNLGACTEDIFTYCCKNNIHISTSLDGPKNLHDAQRLGPPSGTYAQVVHWLKRFYRAYERGNLPFPPSALATVSRESLKRGPEMVDEYRRQKLRGIHLRPVMPFGYSRDVWERIGYEAQDYLSFYRDTCDYILDLNGAGEYFVERYAQIFLTKMLTEFDPNYLDIRSPCGAGIGQLAYNYNGDVYTCDEGRMLGRAGDDIFKVGNVFSDRYNSFIEAPAVKAVCVASCLEGLAGCADCVYVPYCGVCPVCNYVIGKDIFRRAPFLCQTYDGILTYLFDRLKENRNQEIFKRWVMKGGGCA